MIKRSSTTKRSSTVDIIKWVGFFTLAVSLCGSGSFAAPKASSLTKKSVASKSEPVTSGTSVSKVSNLELIYADGGVRVRVHTGAQIGFTHQIEQAKDGKPYRIILDCLNSNHHLGAHQFRSLPKSIVTRIRTSQFAVKPQSVTRIVLDLSKEAFYRVEQHSNFIDVFVTDRKAKRFNSWSSAGWLAARAQNSSENALAVKASDSKATNSSTKSKSIVSKLNTSQQAAPKVVLAKSAPKKIVAQQSTYLKSLKSKSKGPSAKVSTKVVVAKNSTSVKVVPSKEIAGNKSLIKAKSSVRSKPAPQLAKASAKATNSKAKTIASSKSAKNKSLALKADKTSAQAKSSGKVARKKPASSLVSAPAVKPKTGSKHKSSKVTSAKSSTLAAVKSEKQLKKQAAPKKSVSTLAKAKKNVPVAKPANVLANKSATNKKAKQVAKSSKSSKSSKNSQSSQAKPSLLASKAQKSTVQSLPAKKQGKQSTAIGAKKVASKSVVTKKSKAKVTLAKKSSVTKKSAVSKKSATAKKNSSSKKSSAGSSSLFATVANAAPAQDANSVSAKERQYKAQYRRSIDQRKMKLKGTQVAEFPKRLTIKYKTHGTRDPFGTLLLESSDGNPGMMTELPNVEALTMVGILRDTNGKTRGLFEDIDGRGYILSKGDKVRNGTVLKVTKHKAYFQIFEYGWSRTVALSLEG